MTRLVWGVRGVFALGVAASLAANVLHAADHPVSRAIAAWPPIALLLTVELIQRVPVQTRALAAVRLIATGTLAGIAAWVSYWHMADVIRRYGEDATTAHLLPLSVDGMMVVASVCLVEIGRAARKPSPTTEPTPEDIPAPAPEPATEPAPAPNGRKPANPRGYVKTTARQLAARRPDATVPELVDALIAETGTHPKHAATTVTKVLQEGVPA